MNTQPVIVERHYASPLIKVWQAITDIEKLRQWYFDLEDFQARVGFEFQFYGGKDESNPYLHKCRIIEVITEAKLSYSWRYENFPGNSLVTFQLLEQDEGTLLRLTHTGIETFGSNPDFAKEEFTLGWTMFLNDALGEFLNTQ
ncbi:MAG: SRPBCC domain-containing protein [Bacteroidetes bacterium]|nr:SRPBCC domain-containing protein [Bacteroidota bacterium]